MKSIKQTSPTGIRIPEDLKEWLKDQARANVRSLNSEVVFHLEQAKKHSEKRV